MKIVPTLVLTKDDLIVHSKEKSIDEISFEDIISDSKKHHKYDIVIFCDINKGTRILKNRYSI